MHVQSLVLGDDRAALAAAIGSPCPYCGQTMQIPERPPSRDHLLILAGPP
jgi:hypothetical protein